MIKLLDNEKIVTIKRRHWFIIATEGFVLFLIAFSPVFLVFVFYIFDPKVVNLLQDYWLFAIFYAAFWIQIFWSIFFMSWTNYYLDVLLVTNKRIVDIEQLNLFSRDIAEVRLEDIQDIKTEELGFIPHILKMGNLHIQTAGQIKEIFLRDVPDADEIKDIISKYRDEVSHPKLAPSQANPQDKTPQPPTTSEVII